jgi:hypothetical protein
MKNIIFRRRCSGLLILLLVCACTSCVKKEKPQAGLELALKEPVQKILRSAQVDFYPGSTLLKDSVTSQEYYKPASETDRRLRYVSVANVTLTADAPVTSIRNYYQKKCPYPVLPASTGTLDPAKVQPTQLSSVDNIATALTGEISPIVLVEISQPALSEQVIAAYRAEMALLRKNSGKDLAAQKRIRQLEILLAQKPLIRISVRELTSVPVPATAENKR